MGLNLEKESDAILILICTASLLFLKFYLNTIFTIINIGSLLVYLTIFTLFTLVLLKIVFKDSKIALLIIASLSVAVGLTTLLVYLGEDSNTKKELYIVNKKSFYESRSRWSIDNYSLQLQDLKNNRLIKIRSNPVEYNSLEVGDTVDFIYSKNIFYNLETYKGLVQRSSQNGQ